MAATRQCARKGTSMIRRIRSWKCSLMLWLALAMLTGTTTGSAGQNAQVLEVSLPSFFMDPNESVEEIRCQLAGGAIIRMSIPFGWSVNLDTDASASGHAKLSASSPFFSWGLGRTNGLGYFHNFIAVRTMPVPQGLPAPPEDVTVALTIETPAATGPTSRKLTFTRAQLILRPAKDLVH